MSRKKQKVIWGLSAIAWVWGAIENVENGYWPISIFVGIVGLIYFSMWYYRPVQ